MKRAWVWVTGVLLWLFYLGLTNRARLEYYLARERGRKVSGYRAGVFGSSYTVHKQLPPQGRSWLTWREFRTIQIDARLK